MSKDFVILRENTQEKVSENNTTEDGNRCDSRELPTKLKTIAKICEEAAEKLEKKKTFQKHTKNNELSDKECTFPRIAELVKTTTALKSENDRLTKEIDRKTEDVYARKNLEEESEEKSDSLLTAENMKLRQLCKEITSINKRWQNYNVEVQSYIRQLEDVIQSNDMKKKQNLSDPSRSSLPGKDQTSELVERNTSLFIRYNNLLKEMCQLQEKYENSKLMEEKLREQLKQLSLENQEHINVLNYQLSVYKEDYEAEKKEKLIARSTSLELVQELDRVRSKLRECQRRLKQVEQVSRSPAPSSSSRSYELGKMDKDALDIAKNNLVVCDGSSEMSDSIKSSIEETTSKTIVYECPQCLLSFPAEKQQEYLEHFEECQNNETS